MMLPQVMLTLTVVLGLASALVKSYHPILFFKLILINVLVTLGEALSITSMVPQDLAARQTRTTQLLQRSATLGWTVSPQAHIAAGRSKSRTTAATIKSEELETR
jgi:hypothetical protein